jgi:vesicle-fusing ATPase
MSIELSIISSLNDEMGATNCAYVNNLILPKKELFYIKIKDYIFLVKKNNNVPIDKIAFNMNMRKITDYKIDQKLYIDEYLPSNILALKITFQLSHWNNNKVSYIDYQNCQNFIINTLNMHFVTIGQKIYLQYNEIKYAFTIINIDSFDQNGNINNTHAQIIENTEIILKADQTITVDNIPHDLLDTDFAHNKDLLNINPYDLEKLGIGGLSNEFITLFRRAFVSRLLPPSYLKKLNIKHVKGVLLHGPPGTGKTLIARKIGEMLNCKPPKIVNGPEVFNKFVGGTEENIRKLFIDAETEQASKGDKSSLHLIIFDEFDSLCKQRGMARDSTGVNDNVVNQLLSKIDGVESLNNVLLIGLTNRKDLIDEAILRPGRFEVHIEISLPDENGRLEILNIHTNKLKSNDMLSNNVNLNLLAQKTKNFSGAELEGLVRSAQSYSIQKHIDPTNPSQLQNIEKLQIDQHDFDKALQEIKPSFGQSNEIFDKLETNEIINYGQDWIDLENKIKHIFANFNSNSNSNKNLNSLNTFRILFYGDAGSGKTTISSYLAKMTNYPYVKLITPSSFVGYSENQKINIIRKIFTDAYQSKESVIILDDIERLIEFSEYGNRYSNAILQTLLVLINENTKKNNKLIIIGTCKKISIMDSLEIKDCFDENINIPNIEPEHFENVYNMLNININKKNIKENIKENFMPLSIKKLLAKLLV